jgi:sugar/nucleoside kinase (ribokinase family)
MSRLLVVGSLAYDTISTPHGRAERTIGGSANYFSLAASLYSKVRVVGVVGEDYGAADLAMLSSRGVDVAGLQKQPGKTFHWTGQYKDDMNEAITLATELNVFEHFNPQLPIDYRNSEYVFLANIDPVLQLRVLEQIDKPKLVGSDTMNFWINSKLSDLKRVLERVDVLLINEGEADQISQTSNAIAAAKKILGMGPKAVVIKRGEYGFVLYTKEGYFILPAFPIAEVVDPTGAGDTFAGAFFGYLASCDNGYDLTTLRQACVQGCLLASYTVEAFGVGRLKSLTWPEVEARRAIYHKVTSL